MGAGAIFVLPTSTAGQQGPVAAWLSTAGWARGAARVLGDAWIVTSEGVLDATEVRERASQPALSARSSGTWLRSVPTPVKTALKDVRQWQRARNFVVAAEGPWIGGEIAFVWQRHELFHVEGTRLARALDVPSVLFVPATLVWEAQQWGVRRVGWHRWLEQRGEAPALLGADIVACGSSLVAAEVERIGVPANRVLITPTGVDLDVFDEHRATPSLRHDLGLEDHFVVGWVGSFRRFHALDVAVRAVAQVEGTALLLVGDGPERPEVERLARDLHVPVVATGTVPYRDLPSYLAVMDAALVTASTGEEFHYSPLKLAEYLAAGLPTVAPRVAQISDRLVDGDGALLVPPGDVAALADALTLLRDNDELRKRLSTRARELAGSWSWDEQIRRIVAALAPA